MSAEFIEESGRSQLDKTIPKAGGPYSKSQRRKRRQKVMRLHFELCLPAIKIADMLGVSRHTINADIQWLYEKMVADIEGKDFNGFFGKQLVRLETQRTRLMSYLSEAKDLDAKLSLERQLADHDFRLAAIVEKFKHNTFTFWDTVVEKINDLSLFLQLLHSIATILVQSLLLRAFELKHGRLPFYLSGVWLEDRGPNAFDTTSLVVDCRLVEDDCAELV